MLRILILVGDSISTASKPDLKAKVREAIESLPDAATWDDVMCRLYVRWKIDAGCLDIESGNALRVSALRKRFGSFRMRVEWTQNAVSDLAAIYERIESDSPRSALAVVGGITKRTTQIARFQTLVKWCRSITPRIFAR